MKKLFILLTLLFCQSAFSQIDTALNTANIFSIEIKDSVGAYSNMDVSDAEYDEVKILSLDESFIGVKFIEKGKSIEKKIDIRQINAIGYKNGRAGLSGMGWGFGAGLVAGFLTMQIHNSIMKDGGDGGLQKISVVLTAATFPLLGAIGGLIIGAQNDKYNMFELAKMNKEQKYNVIKTAISEGIKNNKKK